MDENITSEILSKVSEFVESVAGNSMFDKLIYHMAYVKDMLYLYEHNKNNERYQLSLKLYKTHLKVLGVIFGVITLKQIEFLSSKIIICKTCHSKLAVKKCILCSGLCACSLECMKDALLEHYDRNEEEERRSMKLMKIESNYKIPTHLDDIPLLFVLSAAISKIEYKSHNEWSKEEEKIFMEYEYLGRKRLEILEKVYSTLDIKKFTELMARLDKAKLCSLCMSGKSMDGKYCSHECLNRIRE